MKILVNKRKKKGSKFSPPNIYSPSPDESPLSLSLQKHYTYTMIHLLQLKIYMPDKTNPNTVNENIYHENVNAIAIRCIPFGNFY